MISHEKIRIYQKYNGRIDKFLRSNKNWEKSVLTNDDWLLIDGILQDCEMIAKGLTSESFKKDFEKRLSKELSGQMLISDFYRLFKIKIDNNY